MSKSSLTISQGEYEDYHLSIHSRTMCSWISPLHTLHFSRRYIKDQISEGRPYFCYSRKKKSSLHWLINDCWGLSSVWDICITLPCTKVQRTFWKMEWKECNSRGMRRVQWNPVLWMRHGCHTHQLTAAMVTGPRPAQVQASQHSSIVMGGA